MSVVGQLAERDAADLATFDPDGPLDDLAAVTAPSAEIPGLVRLFLGMTAAASDPDHATHSYFADRYRALRELVSRKFRSSTVNPKAVDPEFAARILIAASDGLQAPWLLDPTSIWKATSSGWSSFSRWLCEADTVWTIGEAVGMFAATNIDDLVVLSLFFALSRRAGVGPGRVVLGQYLGFGAVLAVSIGGALGVGALPKSVIAYFGLVPVFLGLRAAWTTWRGSSAPDVEQGSAGGPTVLAVAAATFANGGDNIGVYVPVFATSGTGGLVVFTVVFLLLVAIWCAAGHAFAARPVITRALSRWGHVLLPAVLVGIGVVVLGGILAR
ncbi:MAG: putative quaternary amine transporter [Amycolatopsis sp.]|uniref:cadmium resistance transporter n=1 Tax=Amycolatopsis sp. TaxID=37632 RepID=UPI00345A083A|nr:putative quaternary amine transporter [Amycolatopsis sp.]